MEVKITRGVSFHEEKKGDDVFFKKVWEA
jgi:hypothetical protein